MNEDDEEEVKELQNHHNSSSLFHCLFILPHNNIYLYRR